MTFLEHSMVEWIRAIAPHAVQVHACAHGKDWEKRWMFVSNERACFTLAADCPHDKGSRNPDASWKSRETATYPESLACAIAELIFPWVTPEPLVLPLKSWQTALPVKLSWPSIHHRIEDGGGLNSTALWLQPSVHDPLGTLRKRWLQRLCDSKLVVQISAALETGETSDMVSPTQLAPFLDDILSIFQVGSSILDIAPEQPFRLKLWQLLASSFGDLEAPFFDLLAEGVPLGVDTPLQPSPYWPFQPYEPISEDPIRCCDSEWKSAIDHASLVDTLLADEIAAGFIEEIAGGDAALKAQYPDVAVGKLAVIVIEGKSPRLVVDSSVSHVTSRTVLPNHMLLPKRSDVVQCSPVCLATENMQLFSLDVSKAHRRIKIRQQDRGLLCFRHSGRL